MRAAKKLQDKFCEFCGKRFNRKRFNGRLEDAGRFKARRFCSLSCASSKNTVTVAGYRKRAVKHRGDRCERCGTTENLHAHHRDHDITNNAPANISTLCATCHIQGHWREFRQVARVKGRCNYCSAPAHGRGMCHKHYKRWVTHGDPFLVTRGNGSGTWLERVSS